MQNTFPRQRRSSYSTQYCNKQNEPFNPTLKKSEKTIKLIQVQNFKRIEQGYLTPNNFKFKYMCKNHINTKSTHYYQAVDGQKIYYCSTCSNEIIKQGFSVKNINSNMAFNKNENQNQFQPKMFDFLKKKKPSDFGDKFEVLKTTQNKYSQLQRKANLQIIEIDQYGKKLLKQLNCKFNDVIKFLHLQKENCIQIIFDKIDGLKKPLHELKNTIYNEKWQLENIKSRLDILSTQQNTERMNQFFLSISGNQYIKAQRLQKKEQELEKIFHQTKVLNKNNCFQSLGNVQEIIEIVYDNFLLKKQHDNLLSQLNKEPMVECMCQFTVSQFPSPIRNKSLRQPDSNKTLIQQIQNIESTINQSKKQNSMAQPDKIAITSFYNIRKETNQIIKKRPSQTTNFSC